MKPKGIMVHSTGANNPNLCRYVGPDDGKLGENRYGNHWNTYHPGGEEICCHAFIGKLKDGSVATYQTLPWDHRGWHAGGAANSTHIGFEICEDNLSDGDYFAKVYKEAAELCAYLCKMYGLTENDIICHSEGHTKGIASNHADVMHWWPKFGKNMNTFREEVRQLLARESEPAPKPEPAPSQSIKVGDTVKVKKGAKDYNGGGLASFVYTRNHKVSELKGNRAVITYGGVVVAAVHLADLTLTKSAVASKPAASRTIKVGDSVKVKKGAKDYNGGGLASFVYNNTYRVDELKGDRAVLDLKGLCTAFRTTDLIAQ